MNVYSNNLKCYIEGVRIPIISATPIIDRNMLKTAIIKTPLGKLIEPKLWANAAIHVTIIEDNKEKLFYEGLITDIDIVEDPGYILIYTESKWGVLNMNTTLDYTAPKRYGITDLSKEMKVYLGTDEELSFDNNEPENYQMSLRYFFLKDETNLKLDSEDAFKLRFIIDRTPFAELFAFCFFEDISYQNFLLSQSYIQRFNLLSKVPNNSKRMAGVKQRLENIFNASEQLISLDPSRQGIQYKKAEFKKVPVDTDLGAGPIDSNAPYKPIAAGAKLALQNHSSNGVYHTKFGDVSVDLILTLYDQYCKQANIDPNLMIAQAQWESGGFNPNAKSGTGPVGWAQFSEATWKEQVGPDLNQRYSIQISIKAQVRYMRQMFILGGNDWKRALSNYVDGAGATSRPQTPGYINGISSIYDSYITK